VRSWIFIVLLAWLPVASGEKLHFEAYSLQVPASSGWMVTRGGAYDVAFGAAMTPTHTWAMTAAAIPLVKRFERDEEFLAHIRDGFLRDSDPARFRIVSSDGRVERLNGATCARLALKAEDGPHFIIEATQITCMHPSAPGLVIEVGYHERYLPGEASGALSDAGERFIRSVRFWRPVPAAPTRSAAAPSSRSSQ
jgi:hypothetical protein